MIKFLDEVTTLQTIKELAKHSESARIAVAFWGDGAMKTLGLNRTGLDLEVICNLDSGACNPKEIRELKERIAVRSHPKLHGKVYLMDKAVVIGSSNASTNGLALELGLAGWCEANVFTDDPAVVKDVSAWFSERKRESYAISEDDIVLSEKIWLDRKRAAPSGSRLSKDLVKAFRNSPEHPVWKKVKIAIYTELDLSDEGEDEKANTLAENPALKGCDVYEGWHEAFEEDDWVIDLAIYRKQGVFGGYWRVPSPKIETDLLTFVHEEDAMSLPGFGKMTISKADLALLRKSAVGLLGSERPVETTARMVGLAEAIGFIDRSA